MKRTAQLTSSSLSNPTSELKFWSLAAVRSLQALASVKTFPSSVVLIEQDSPVGTVYLLERGIVKLLRWEAVVDRDIVVVLRYSGWLLGAATVILQRPSPVTAQTVTPCRVWELRSDRFLEEMKRNPALSWQIHLLHSRWLHDQFEQVAAVGTLSARRRLERLLWDLCKTQRSSRSDKPIRLLPALKRSELAEAVMISPQHLSRLLGALESEQLIRRQKGWLVICEPHKLWSSVHPQGRS